MTATCVSLFSALLLAQTGAAPAGGGKATVTFVHASADGPAVDVFVNGAKVGNIAFGKTTELKDAAAGTAKVELKAGDKAVYTKDVTLAADTTYTVVAFGPKDKIDASVVTAKTPAAGKAHVYFVHASPDAGAVDLKLDGKDPQKGFALGKTWDTTVDAGKHKVELFAGSAEAVLTKDLDTAADTCYCVVIAGMAKGTPKLDAIVTRHSMKKAAAAPAPAKGHEGHDHDKK